MLTLDEGQIKWYLQSLIAYKYNILYNYAKRQPGQKKNAIKPVQNLIASLSYSQFKDYRFEIKIWEKFIIRDMELCWIRIKIPFFKSE